MGRWVDGSGAVLWLRPGELAQVSDGRFSERLVPELVAIRGPRSVRRQFKLIRPLVVEALRSRLGGDAGAMAAVDRAAREIAAEISTGLEAATASRPVGSRHRVRGAAALTPFSVTCGGAVRSCLCRDASSDQHGRPDTDIGGGRVGQGLAALELYRNPRCGPRRAGVLAIEEPRSGCTPRARAVARSPAT